MKTHYLNACHLYKIIKKTKKLPLFSGTSTFSTNSSTSVGASTWKAV
jgi:hypothetical protein